MSREFELCHRCGAMLEPGRSDFFLVRIEAFADPSPPKLAVGEPGSADPAEEMRRLIEQMSGMSERELMDQVHRRLSLHLCGPCFRVWIEDPTP